MQPGRVLGERFELLSRAGEGGMATVWRARDLDSGHDVALKILAAERDRERLLREASILRELSHPHVVRYIADGRADDRTFLVMEWLDGEDLQTRLTRGALPLNEAVALGIRVADALAAMHANEVVHRDVKPSNVVLVGGEVNHLRLVDFGIAGWAAARALTMHGAVIGTPGYMAPEQARGEEADERADIFALGCVLFECLTGEPIFKANHVAALLVMVLLEDAPALSSVCEGVPPMLDELVAAMVGKEPDARPRSAIEVRAMLESIASGIDAAAGEKRVGRSQRPPVMGRSEQRLVSVVVAAPTTVLAVPFEGETIDGDVVDDAGSVIEDVSKRFRARCERIAGGTFAALIEPEGSIREQARSAARCALAMRASRLEGQVALATGRAELSARLPVGQVIERAVSAARRGSARGVRIDELTAGLLDAEFEVSEDERGLLLVAERSLPTQVRPLLGRVPPFVGRRRQLATLRAALDECLEEPAATAVVVAGPAGAGKTRLCAELIRDVEGEHTVWRARAEAGAQSPLALVAALARRAAGVEDGEACESGRRKLGRRIARHVPAAEADEVTMFVAEACSLPFEPGDVQLRAARRDAVLMGDRVRRAFGAWLEAEASAAPLVLWLEDVHWADRASLELLEHLLGTLEDLPVMILATARPENTGGLWVGRGATHVNLAGLTAKAARKLARAVLGSDVDAEKVDGLIRRAGGNPFHLEELLREAAKGRWDVAPPTVVALGQHRLAALDAEPRRVLRAASVLGERFRVSAVAHLLGEQVASVEAHLAVLTEAEVVTPTDPGGYAFRHALLRDAAQSMLTADDERIAHRLAADWHARDTAGDPRVVAEHYVRGGAPEESVPFWVRAAEQARDAGDFEDALRCTARGRETEPGSDAVARFAVVEAEAQFWRGELSLAFEAALLAATSIEVGADGWRRAVLWGARAGQRLGLFDPLVEVIGHTLGATDIDPEVRADVLAHLSVAFAVGGRWDRARALLGEIERTLDVDSLDPGVAACVHRARAARALHGGDSAGYLASLQRSASCSREAGDLRIANGQLANVAYAKLELGLARDAEEDLRTALRIAADIGVTVLEGPALHNLGLALHRQGRNAEAREVESRAVELTREMGDKRLEGGSRVYLAMILAALDETVAAESELRTALVLTAEVPPMRSYTEAVLAQLLLARGRAEEALEHAVSAYERTASRGNQGGAALVRLVHAEAVHATGDIARARELIDEALGRVMERAARIDREDWRRSFLDDVPEHARTIELAEAWS